MRFMLPRKKLPHLLAAGFVLCAATAAVAADNSQQDNASIKKLQAAAANGDVNSELALGTIYHGGNGVKQDNAKAAQWWLKAAEAGNPLAEFLIGEAYHEGIGVGRDDARAIAWWHKSADQGNADAENNLGYVYYNGVGGIRKNITEGIKWWRKAAMQGDSDAQFSLGAAYYNGDGVSQNYVMAHTWFKLASQHNNAAAAQLLDQVEKVMTPAQIDKADDMTLSWEQRIATAQNKKNLDK
jgi:TPR repeat protein